MVQLAIIADDLTGAADTASCFAAAGFTTFIPLMRDVPLEADVLAISTESRDLDAAGARAAVACAAASLNWQEPHQSGCWLYKKIDSALRGHPCDELLALMESVGASRALVAPAFPAEGRTTEGGCQFVDGQLLEASRFGGPGVTSDLQAVFANDRGLAVRVIPLATIRAGSDAVSDELRLDAAGITIADAETDADLATLAHSVKSRRELVLCGAAGFSRQLALVLPLVPLVDPGTPASTRNMPILVVAGSRHAATLRQVTSLREAGTPVVTLAQELIDDAAASLEPALAEVAAVLVAGRSAVVTTGGRSLSSLSQRDVAATLAAVATAPQIRPYLGGMVLTGGDVAAAVCTALGAVAIRLGGDVQPGIPWGILEGGALPGLPIVTKAGSFGEEDALLAATAHLREHARFGLNHAHSMSLRRPMTNADS